MTSFLQATRFRGLKLTLCATTFVSISLFAPSFSFATGVSNVVQIQKIVSNGYAACYLSTEGQIGCWGLNAFGQVGMPVKTNTSSFSENVVFEPNLLNLPTESIDVSAGTGHMCAIDSLGKVRCWGQNSYGQASGSGNYDRDAWFSTPVEIQLPEAAKQVVAGDVFSCALLQTGMVSCWGENYFGELGLGFTSSPVSALPPTVIPSLNQVVSLSAARQSICALESSHKVFCWGGNFEGQLGLGFVSPNVSTPTEVPSLDGATEIKFGAQHGCAQFFAGEIKCWGRNNSSQIGLPDGGYPAVRPTLLGITNVKSLSLAGDSTCVILENNDAICWGAFYGGGMYPNKIEENVNQIFSNGAGSHLILRKDGTVWGLGYNYLNQLALGNQIGQNMSSTGFDSVPLTQVPQFSGLRPMPPEINAVLVGNRRAELHFTESKYFGVSDSTNFAYSLDSGNTWHNVSPAQVNSPVSIFGLTNGETYSIKLRGINAVGEGMPSESVQVTPQETAPSAPQIQRVGATYKGLHVHFAVPDDDGGSPISGYQYSIDESTWSTVKLIPGVTAFKIPGLGDNRSYSVRMRACNSQGCSSPSDTSFGTTANIPGAVTIKSISTRTRALIVNATIPGNYASPVLHIEYSLDGGSTWQNPVPATRVSPLKIMGLNPSTNYSVRVRAVNRVGVGEGSNLVSVTTLAR